jgi:hypothetical protein
MTKITYLGWYDEPGNPLGGYREVIEEGNHYYGYYEVVVTHPSSFWSGRWVTLDDGSKHWGDGLNVVLRLSKEEYQAWPEEEKKRQLENLKNDTHPTGSIYIRYLPTRSEQAAAITRLIRREYAVWALKEKTGKEPTTEEVDAYVKIVKDKERRSAVLKFVLFLLVCWGLNTYPLNTHPLVAVPLLVGAYLLYLFIGSVYQ